MILIIVLTNASMNILQRVDNMARPDKDEYFMRMVDLASERTTCLRRKVGAVLVKDGHVISTGYNGAPRGLKHCEEVGCVRQKLNIPSGERQELCRAVHAEQNAIIQAAYHGTSTKDATIYCNYHPCVQCAKIIINAGIKEIVYGDEAYTDNLSRVMLEESGITTRKYVTKVIPIVWNDRSLISAGVLWSNNQNGLWNNACPVCHTPFQFSSYRYNCCGKVCEEIYESGHSEWLEDSIKKDPNSEFVIATKERLRKAGRNV
jgi:dCMP deaminase